MKKKISRFINYNHIKEKKYDYHKFFKFYNKYKIVQKLVKLNNLLIKHKVEQLNQILYY